MGLLIREPLVGFQSKITSQVVFVGTINCRKRPGSVALCQLYFGRPLKDTPSLFARGYSASTSNHSLNHKISVTKNELNANPPKIYDKVFKHLRAVGVESSSVSEISKEAKYMKENARPLPTEGKKKSGFLQEFVKRFPRREDLERLLKEFAAKTGHEEVTLITYSRLIHVFSQSGDFRRAQETFDLMLANNVTPNEQTYCALMNAYSNGGELNKTIEIFKQIRNDPESRNHFAYAILVKAYMKHGRVRDAFDVLEMMKQKLTPDIQVYNSLIQGCIDARDSSRAWVAYDMLLKDGCRPDKATYTMMISASQKHNVKKALELFGEFLKRDMTPNYKVVTSLLSSLCSRPEFYSKSIELLNTLVSQRYFIPDAFIFNTMIKGAALNRNLADARNFFFRLQQTRCDPGVQLTSYSSMFEAYAIAFLVDCKERAFNPHQSEKYSDFTFLLRLPPICQEDLVNEAMRFLPFLKSIDASKEPLQSKTWPWISFLSILANYNYFNEAMEFFTIISKKFEGQLCLRYYNCMLEMCTRLQKEDAFFAIMEGTKAISRAIGPDSDLTLQERIDYKHRNSLSPEQIEGLYQKIIMGLVRFDRLEEASKYFKVIAQDRAVNWRKKAVYYGPYFEAIRNSRNAQNVYHDLQIQKAGY